MASTRSGYPAEWPLAGGECAALLRSIDWSHSPLGPVESWSASLRTSVDIVLGSPTPMVLMWGSQHVMIYNDHCIPLAGSKHPAAFGGVPCVISPENWQWARDVLAAGLRGEAQVFRDQQLKRRHGERLEDVWFDLHYTPVRDESGNVAGVLCKVTVTTERVATANRLQESEQRYREMVENSPNLIFTHRDDRITFINSAGLALLGASAADQIVGRSPLDLYHPRHHEAVRKRIAKLEQSPQMAPLLEAKMMRLDGETREVEIRAASFLSGGEITIQAVCRDLSPWKAAQRKLNENQRLLAIAGRAASIGGWQIDLASRRVAWSDEVCAIHEVEPGVVSTMDEAISFYPPEWRGRVRRAFERCVSENVPFDEEREIVTTGGTRKWVRAVGYCVRDDSGAVVQVQGAFQDISERKKAETLLSESQRQFRQHADAMPLIVWTATADGLLDYGSRRMIEYIGKDAEAIHGAGWAESVHPEDLERTVSEWAAAVAAGGKYNHEFRLRRYDGVFRWHALSAIPVRGEDGAISKWIGTALDIHDRKLTEQASKESEARFRTVAKATADLVWDWNIAGDSVWWNDDVLNLYGRMPAPDEPGVAAWAERLHPDDRERVLSGFRSAVAGQDEYWSAEYRLIRPDNSVAHLLDSAFIVRDPDGRAIRMVGGIRDVSRDVEMEAKLRQSQRLETMGQLTGGVAHDFNNLLTVILGNAEILEDSLGGESRLRPLAEMTRIAAERGADLTHRLLAFARRQPLAPASVDVNKLVAGMDSLLRRTLAEDIEIEFVRGGRVWKAYVDAPQLESALLNLAINARDAMPEGGRLTIETANIRLDGDAAAREGDLAPGPYVVIAVSDNGAGMSPEVLEQAFQPFFTTKEAGKGSGLGLSMVYGFVKQSGGHAKICSQPGQGTTVRLYLPRADRDADLEDLHSEESEPVRGREKILVVEDDELVRSHVGAQLTGLGYRVISVSNGPEALIALEQEDDFDLVFTDVVMPGGLNGRQLAERVSQLRPNLPILFTSGYTESAIVHHGRLDSGLHLLNKPYRRKDLADKIRLVLSEPPTDFHQPDAP